MTQPSKVLADGCFDPLHVGHVAYLEAAAALGELYVHVASDAEIRKKGRESFQLQPERCRTVRALKCVADVFVHPTLKDAILRLQPRVLVKGRDWIGKLPADVVAACREVGTVIVYTDTQERTSTERLKGNDIAWDRSGNCYSRVEKNADGSRYWDRASCEWVRI